MSPAKTSLFFALALFGASSVASAQSATSFVFEVSAGEGGQFPMLTNVSGNVIDYAFADGSVDFRLDAGASYDNPMFCFDFSDQGSAVKLNAVDANGHVVMNAIGLKSTLGYDLASGSIGLSPSASVQCFFKGANSTSPQFGPFGEVADNQRTATGAIGLFSDSFAAFPDLDIRYDNLQVNSGNVLDFAGAAVSPDDVISYDLIIENTGNAAATELALQEVFPAYQIVNDLQQSSFAAALSEGIWDCVSSGNASCPAAEGLGELRFETLSLPVDSSLTFTITRQVMSASEGVIRLFAGAVSGPGSTAESAVAEVDLDIVGAVSEIAFRNQPSDTEIGFDIIGMDELPIEVEAVDANGNQVETFNAGQVSLELFNSNGFVAQLATYQNIVDGSVIFQNLTTDNPDISTGSGYKLKAIPSDTALFNIIESNTFSITAAN